MSIGPDHQVSISTSSESEQASDSTGSLLNEATKMLASAGIEQTRPEARLLLQEAMNVSKSWLMAHPEAVVPPDRRHRYMNFVKRRARREPAAYITGHREFYGLDLLVDPSTLIPRPETELLVETTLTVCDRLIREKGRHITIVELGTGSGAVAIALATQRPELTVTAIDTSSLALRVAALNAQRHGVAGRVDFRPGDLLDGFEDRIDLLVANLPYVPSGEVDRLMPEVGRYEPRIALDGGPDGTMLICRTLEQARSLMDPPAALLFEIGDGQGKALTESARNLYPGADVTLLRDYAGLERVLSIGLRWDKSPAARRPAGRAAGPCSEA